MAQVEAIYRYPIKGLSPQALPSVTLEAGGAFPFDRVFALIRPGAPIDPEAPQWAKKGLFLMSMLDDGLSEVVTAVDPDTLRLTIARDRETLLVADLDTREGRTAVEAFFGGRVPGLREAPRLARSRDGHFMDKPDNLISLINLATLRALERQWGYSIDPLRFRANLYVDGVEPWREFDWIGADLRIGGVAFRVDRRNGRCAATNVDPVTGWRDRDIPGALRAAFGHKDLGVYLRALEAGVVAVGDSVEPPAAVAPPLPAAPAVATSAGGRFICRGCYFIYDEGEDAAGKGEAFADLPASWRCPDCGTGRANFRPHGPAVGARDPA